MDRILIILKKENGPRASSAPALGLNTIIFKYVHWYMKQISGERLQDHWSSGFSFPLTKVDIHFGHVRMYATPYPISWIIFILDSEPSYTDKLLEFRWVQIAPLSYLIYFYTATKEIKWILLTMTIKLMLSRL